MSADDSFGAILSQPFRWPQAGDRLFQRAEAWYDSAWVPQHPAQRMAFMIAGYKKAGDLIVRNAMADRAMRDFLVYPAIFAYRHLIELWLKSLIETYGPTVGIAPNWKTHSLASLWTTFLGVLEAYGVENEDDGTKVVAALVAEFAKVDPASFSYRYPTDTKGNPVPLDHEQLDLRALAEAIHGMNGYFTGCDGYLDSLKNAAP